MNTKLTLRMDEALIARAKLHSEQSGKSLSRLVSEFFSAMDAPAAQGGITPRVKSLMGALSQAAVDEDDYRRHLEAKHS